MGKLKNVKHEKVVRNVAKGMSQTDAYHAVYDCKRRTATEKSSALMKKPEVQTRLAEILDHCDGSLEKIVKKTVQDLDADKDVVTKSGVISIKDNPTRQKAQEMLYKLHKAPGFGGSDNNVTNNTVNMNVTPELLEKFTQLVGKLETLNNVMLSNPVIQDGEIID